MGQGRRWTRTKRMALGALLALAACKQDAELVASNCVQEGSCVEEEQALEKIEEVDILLVIDSSASMESETEALKAQLPRMLNAIVSGSDGDTDFPPASSVHIAVTTSDMGVGGNEGLELCYGVGDDGIFVQPGQGEVSCATELEGYVPFQGAGSAMSAEATVSCVPLTGVDGCGFEQPLEAALKSVWPASDTLLTFLGGPSHGEDANAGFLREDSLLVVVVVSDEDDCSAEDTSIFDPSLPETDPRSSQSINLRCFLNPEALYSPERYIENFKALRPDNDNVIFATISGIPPELISEAARAAFDFEVPEQVAAFYDSVLAAPAMQEVPDPAARTEPGYEHLTPSCSIAGALSFPPRRLVQVAKGFGTSGVLGSLCTDDFGDTTGAIIRAIAERLISAAEGPPDAG